MSEEQIKEIKRDICVNCGDRCCHGMRSCKDVNKYMKKRGGNKND